MERKIKVAILDDYQNAALLMADWSGLAEKAEITIFLDHLSDQDELAQRLLGFDAICVMRERTPFDKNLINRLPNLKLIVSTGFANSALDVNAAAQAGVAVKNTGYHVTGAPELAWALLMAIARKIPQENSSLRSGDWQTSVGTDLNGKIIGIVGLGNIGKQITRYAHVFGMKVIAWSPNLTAATAQEYGAEAVSRETLFSQSDFVTVHLVLSERSRGIIDRSDLRLMKPSAYLINTSRGPLINESALIEILTEQRIAGAALDVFDEEPLPLDHPFRRLTNVLATPHIGYVTEDTYKLFFADTVKAVAEWLDAR